MYESSWSNRFEVKPNRWVYNPTNSCRSIGKGIQWKLRKRWTPPPYYYHLRDGGHVAAIEVHLENNFFATLDIKDFFGSISRTRVTRALKKFFPYIEARSFAKQSTVKVMGNYPFSHQLPYGFVQSPILASLCLFDSKLGRELHVLHNKKKALVSIYMDDILISSSNKDELIEIYEKLKIDLVKSKFNLNESKSLPVSDSVTAFNIDFKNNDKRINYDRFVRFQYAYFLSNSKAQKKGIASYVGSVNKSQAKLLI